MEGVIHSVTRTLIAFYIRIKESWVVWTTITSKIKTVVDYYLFNIKHILFKFFYNNNQAYFIDEVLIKLATQKRPPPPAFFFILLFSSLTFLITSRSFWQNVSFLLVFISIIYLGLLKYNWIYMFNKLL